MEITQTHDHTIQTRHSGEDPTPPPHEYRAVTILLILYWIQGTTTAFYASSMSLLFLDKGATIGDLGVLSFILYPFSFKLLFAPFMDYYYKDSIGKRKSYVLPAQYIFAGLQIIMSFFINSVIDNLQYGLMAVLGFISVLAVAIQDVAVDGWALTLLHKNNKKYAAATQQIGGLLGGLFGYTVFIYLSSQDICREYLGLSDALLSARSFTLMLGIITLIVTLVVQFYVEEKPTNRSEDDSLSIAKTFKLYKGFWYNKHVAGLILFYLTFRLGFMPIDAGASVLMLKKQVVTMEQLTTIGTFGIAVSLVSSSLISKYTKDKSPFLIITKVALMRIASCALIYIVVVVSSPENASAAYYWYFVIQMIDTFVATAFLPATSIVADVSEVKFGGIYMTTMYSFMNFGAKMGDSLALFLLKFIDYVVLCPIGLISVAIYMTVLWKPYLKAWSQLPHEAWAISPYSEGPIEETQPLAKERLEEKIEML